MLYTKCHLEKKAKSGKQRRDEIAKFQRILDLLLSQIPKKKFSFWKAILVDEVNERLPSGSSSNNATEYSSEQSVF